MVSYYTFLRIYKKILKYFSTTGKKPFYLNLNPMFSWNTLFVLCTLDRIKTKENKKNFLLLNKKRHKFKKDPTSICYCHINNMILWTREKFNYFWLIKITTKINKLLNHDYWGILIQNFWINWLLKYFSSFFYDKFELLNLNHSKLL